MALKFRRGTTAQKSGSLAFGEPYVNTTLGTLQIGLDTGDVSLATQGTASSAQFGAISGSGLDIIGNARVGGNLTLGGNITIGDQSSDTVVVSANLSSSLIPKDNDAFDIGIPSKRYKTIYAQNISASLITIESGSWSELQLKNTDRGVSYHIQNTAGANFSIHNDIINSSVFRIDSGSTLADSHVHIFADLYIQTGSVFVGEEISAATGSFGNIRTTNTISGSIVGIGNVTNYSASVNSRLIDIQNTTSSLNTFTASENTKSETLRLYTASVDTKFSTLQTYTASIDTKFTTLQSLTASNLTRFTRIEESTASLNAFSASENTKAATLQAYTTSVDVKFTTLQTYTASVDSKFLRIQESTASLNTFSASENTKSETLRLYTASIDTKFTTLQTLTASVQSQLTDIQSYTSSLRAAITASGVNVTINGDTTVKGNLFVQGTQTVVDSTTVNIADNVLVLNAAGTSDGGLVVRDATGGVTTSGSFLYDVTNDFWKAGRLGSESQILVAGGMGVVSGSAQIVGVLSNLNTYTSSQDTKNTILQSYTASIDAKFITIQSLTASNLSRLTNLESATASLFIDTNNLELFTSSINTTIKTKLDTDGVVSGSAQVIGILSSLNTYTGSNDTTNTTQNNRLSRLEESTASLNAFSASQLSKDSTLQTYTASVDTKFSTLQTLTASIATQISRLQESTASLNLYTSSQDSKNTTLQSYTASVDTKFVTLQSLTASNLARFQRIEESTASLNLFSASINTFTASENTKSETLRLYTASIDGKFTTLQSYTASIDSTIARLRESTASLNLYTQSNDTTNTTQNNRLSRLEESTASLNAFSASENTKAATLQTYTASVDTKFLRIQESTASLNLFSASINTFTASENTKAETLRLYTASIDTKFSTLATYTGSNDTTNTAQNARLSRLEESTASLNSLTSSYARTNVANVFTATQTISGSLFITQDLIVGGSSSIQNISSSRLDIGDNIIQLNVNNPVLRFGGIAVYDSGSAGGSGSFLYDSVEDEFIFVHRGNGVNVTSSHFIMGPETYDNVGNETYLTNNRLPKGSGKEHLNDSNITDTGTLITLGSNTVVNGTLVASGTSLVSASAQINYTQLSGISANIISASTDSSNVDFIISGGSITANLFGGVVSGSSQITAGSTTNFATDVKTQLNSNTVVSGSAQVVGILSSLNTYTGSNDTTNTAQNNRLTRIEESTSSLNTITASLATTYEGRASATKTLFSGSSQVSHDSTTGYSANRHIDHTTVSITAGSGLSGGGDISATRTLSIATGGVTDAMLAGSISNSKLTNSSITIAGQSTALGSSVTAETIRTAIGTVVTGSAQISGTGITNNTITIAGQSTALGSSVTAETIRTAIGTVVTGSAQIAIASTSGFGTYLNQAVLSTSSPTFAGLTINGAITATGDITAYYSSDKRYKNNIQPITDALAKVRTLNGVTWEWNDDVNEVTKAAPKTGLIAQEVQSVLPEVVKEKEDGYLGLDYAKMMGLMVEAIKEQQLQIEKLQLEVADLKKQKGL
jgi:hypothetical protein